jgi:chromosome segregation ATPase
MSQCNRLIDKIDDGHALMREFDKQTPQSTAQISQDLDALVEELKAVELSDRQLQTYRDRFAKIYSDLSDSFATTSTALASAQQAQSNKSGRQQVQQARTRVEQASQQAEQAAKKADAIATEMNAYCHP